METPFAVRRVLVLSNISRRIAPQGMAAFTLARIDPMTAFAVSGSMASCDTPLVTRTLWRISSSGCTSNASRLRSLAADDH